MPQQPQLTLFSAPRRSMPSELVVDSFAGGGGASLGIQLALGRHVDIAINHDREAIALHARNHPETEHHCEDIREVDAVEATRGRPVALMWASPDCRHFSRAKGGKPASAGVRGLADVVVEWARRVRPSLILLENVEEFQTWGPLDQEGIPIKELAGSTFAEWTNDLRSLGYRLEYRMLRACDYGAPTTRRRLFVIARCDDLPIVWPAPTHGPGRPAPHRTAAECIDWTLTSSSIFDRTKPLAEPTLARIALAIKRHVLDASAPFIVHGGAQTLIQTGYGEREGQQPRALDLHKPLGTVVAGGSKHALVTAYLREHIDYVPRVEERAHDVSALLIKYYGAGGDQSLLRPLDTITTKDRFALVTVRGVRHCIYDIGIRMLAPRELARAQGFPDSYALDATCFGEPLSRSAQTRMIGNSVCPPVAAALVRANALGLARSRLAA